MARILAFLWGLCLKFPPVMLVYRTVQELKHDDATHMAAGVAYYSILSLFPLTIGILAVFSPLLPSDTVESAFLDFLRTYLPGSDEAFRQNLEATGGVRSAIGIVSVLGMFWSASAIFGAISKAVNRAWDVHQDRPFYIDKARHIAMAFSVGLLFLLSVSSTSLLQFADTLAADSGGMVRFLEHGTVNTIARVLPFAFSLAIFLMIYKYVPNTTTHWRYIWPGALLAAFAFEVSKGFFVFYLDNFANFEAVYGSLGSVVVLLLWTYVSSLTLIVGAEFTSEYERMLKGVEQGRAIPKS
ncbi:MAG: YihY/virulence factor BrkB family protein [Chloroflexota bacterium]|nr:YihY/virulence factor BrkB family protein [Chloroflexota bacterium]MDE2969358.1 YihY/virulence factor BrkB family protein [Chloroflexota bacterium]